MGEVTYKLDLERGRKKVWHINSLKKVVEREAEILKITIVADDIPEKDTQEPCKGFRLSEIDVLKAKFAHVLSEAPCKTSISSLSIDTGLPNQ